MVNNLEKIKAKIEFFKTLFLLSIATLFSLIGYLFTQFESLSDIKFFMIVYVIIFLVAIVLIFLILWLKEISKLGENDERNIC